MADKPVKGTEALRIAAEVADGASLPQVIASAIKIARRVDACVVFSWGKRDHVVTPEDTYQGVQRKVQRALAPEKAKGK